MKAKKRGWAKGWALMMSFGLAAAAVLPPVPAEAAPAARQMENLGRGVVAVRAGSNVFVSWRLLAKDASDLGFNVYRSTAGGTAQKLNTETLTLGTNFTDRTADRTQTNAYFVRPVSGGNEQAASESFALPANAPDEPAFIVPLREGGEIGNVWVGDLDGDHEYDYVLSRRATETQTLEAYKRDGTFLWSVDLGPGSVNKNNISPGPTAIDVGMWDGVTVYDLDGDGKAEVALRIANGVTFGDGSKWSTRNSDDKQWLAVLGGMNGSLKKYAALPDDYAADGPLAMQLGIGYLDGQKPSLVAFMKNRKPNRSFNAVVAAYRYTGNNLALQWTWKRGSQAASDGHQMRIIDVDGDGKDEIAEIGFVLNGDGTLRYSLADQGVIHGDRFYIGDLDPNRPGLEGYGIQQDNGNGLLEYYYDAATGNMLWQHSTTPPAGDVGRGDVGDLDPRYPGYETWSFSGIYNGSGNRQVTPSGTQPWPSIRIWWDGDLLSEQLHENVINKWNYLTNGSSRVESLYKYRNASLNYRSVSLFYGDIIGDWREEVIMSADNYSKLVVFTTDVPTDTRLYTMAQNPAYRNSMTIKGYAQSHLTDYFLGEGMSEPMRPNLILTP
ncbi:hypothetical protein [Saccharibacillus sacchari]|uniref:Uncharacterized protein n=1 Tax=Saccharibacillus sacchari TaxID=456493 RepID=A0ACC6P8U7_9BACL